VNAEFVLVDDRSTDGTGCVGGISLPRAMIVFAFCTSATCRRDGWARSTPCIAGTQLATGDWLLFSDADVHVQPGTLTARWPNVSGKAWITSVYSRRLGAARSCSTS
jgi:hypothetical protein